MKPTDAHRAIQLLPFERYRLAELSDTKNNPLSKYKRLRGNLPKQAVAHRASFGFRITTRSPPLGLILCKENT